MMTNLVAKAVLDLSILSEMYGDDSVETVCPVLVGFRNEAHLYIGQLQHALSVQDSAEVARLSHSLKTMSGLIGAGQLMLLCQRTEQAARQNDHLALKACEHDLTLAWPALLSQLQNSLQQCGFDDV